MSHSDVLRAFEIGRYIVTIYVDDYHESMDLDNFTVTDRHQGGVTVRNPVNPGDNRCYQWFIPEYCSVSELGSDYAKQGRENPCGEAYASLQHQLGWCLTASMHGFRVTVEKNGICLADVNAGFCFDYSWEYSDTTLEKYCDDFRDVMRECVHEAVTEARDALRGLAA